MSNSKDTLRDIINRENNIKNCRECPYFSLKNSKPSGWVDRLEDVPEFAIYALSLSAKGKTKKAMLDYLEKWQHIKPKTTGHDLKELGLSPGPEYKRIIRQLRNAWLDGEIKSDTEEKALLGRLL